MSRLPGSQGGFPGDVTKHHTARTSVTESRFHVVGHGQLALNHWMDRDEAERLEMRRKGICFWYNTGENCRFGDDCKFIHTRQKMVLKSFWCKYYVAGRDCFAAENCRYSHDTAGVVCTKFRNSGMCRRGDQCVFVHEREVAEDAEVPQGKSIIEDEVKNARRGGKQVVQRTLVQWWWLFQRRGPGIQKSL